MCSGKEGVGKRGDRAGNEGGGSITRVLQCQSRECGLYRESSGEPKGLSSLGRGGPPSSFVRQPRGGGVIQARVDAVYFGQGHWGRGQQADSGPGAGKMWRMR